MTRIEGGGNLDRQALVADIKNAVRQETARGLRRRFVIKLGITAAVIGLLLGAVAYGLALSGLANVPVLTGWIYRPAVPSRLVNPLAGATGAQVAAAIPLRAKYAPTTGLATLSISEAELTTMLVDGAARQMPGVRTVQAAVGSEGIEAFATFDRGERVVSTLLTMTPVVRDGQIAVELHDARIGGLTVPAWLRSLSGAALSRTLREALSQGLGGGAVTAVTLSQGAVDITLRVPNP